jgi:hypothetical protein
MYKVTELSVDPDGIMPSPTKSLIIILQIYIIDKRRQVSIFDLEPLIITRLISTLTATKFQEISGP